MEQQPLQSDPSIEGDEKNRENSLAVLTHYSGLRPLSKKIVGKPSGCYGFDTALVVNVRRSDRKISIQSFYRKPMRSYHRDHSNAAI